MKRFSKLMLFGLSIGILAIVLGTFTNHPSAQAAGNLPTIPTVPVAVQNTPLPVTGNVNANITNGTIPISGTVAISGTVTPSNTNGTPLFVQNVPSAQRFVVSSCGGATGSSLSDCLFQVTLNSNDVLLAQHISGIVVVSPSGAPAPDVEFLNRTVIPHLLFSSPTGDEYVVSEQTTFYQPGPNNPTSSFSLVGVRVVLSCPGCNSSVQYSRFTIDRQIASQ